jgi:hypothetical protein
LQLQGNFDEPSELYVIAAFFKSLNLTKSASIDFIVDTGSSKTTINDKDAERLEIDYNSLIPTSEKYFGVGGTKVESFSLKNCRLLFSDASGNPYVEQLEEVLVMRHIFKSDDDKRMIMGFNSILGLDILRKYRISFSNLTVFIE